MYMNTLCSSVAGMDDDMVSSRYMWDLLPTLLQRSQSASSMMKARIDEGRGHFFAGPSKTSKQGEQGGYLLKLKYTLLHIKHSAVPFSV